MWRLLFACVFLALTLAACGGDDRPLLEPAEYVDIRPFRLPSEGRVQAYPYNGAGAYWYTGFVSTVPLRDPCVRTEKGTTCEPPAKELDEGGVFLTDVNGGGARLWETDARGAARTLAGFEARIERRDDIPCMLGKSDRTLFISIRQPDTPGFWLLQVCLRGPDIDSVEADLLAYLDRSRRPD